MNEQETQAAFTRVSLLLWFDIQATEESGETFEEKAQAFHVGVA